MSYTYRSAGLARDDAEADLSRRGYAFNQDTGFWTKGGHSVYIRVVAVFGGYRADEVDDLDDEE